MVICIVHPSIYNHAVFSGCWSYWWLVSCLSCPPPPPPRPSLASGVVSPLFTKAAVDLITHKLVGKEQEVWNQLGGNWFLTL